MCPALGGKVDMLPHRKMSAKFLFKTRGELCWSCRASQLRIVAMRRSAMDVRSAARNPLLDCRDGQMAKSPLEPPPKIVSIDCPRCGSRGFISQQAPLTDDVKIYICGECGERTEITVLN